LRDKHRIPLPPSHSRARQGPFAISGNHDNIFDFEGKISPGRIAGIRVLYSPAIHTQSQYLDRLLALAGEVQAHAAWMLAEGIPLDGPKQENEAGIFS
jgi:hypothetical protein